MSISHEHYQNKLEHAHMYNDNLLILTQVFPIINGKKTESIEILG